MCVGGLFQADEAGEDLEGLSQGGFFVVHAVAIGALFVLCGDGCGLVVGFGLFIRHLLL